MLSSRPAVRRLIEPVHVFRAGDAAPPPAIGVERSTSVNADPDRAARIVPARRGSDASADPAASAHGGGHRRRGRRRTPSRTPGAGRLPLTGYSPHPDTEEREAWQKLARSKRKADKLMGRIERALAAGNHHAARDLQRVYLKSYHAAHGAARDAVRGAKHMGNRLDAAHIGAAGALLHANSDGEEIRVRPREKPDGSFRLTCEYGPEDATRQTLALRGLEPFTDLLPCQFGVRGKGAKDAVRCLKALLGERRPNGRYRFRHFKALDVRDCYGSILADRLGDFLKDKLPQSVIREALTNLHRGTDIRIERDPSHIGERASHKGTPAREGAIAKLPQGPLPRPWSQRSCSHGCSAPRGCRRT
jgi:hypothetical protein